MPDDSPITSAMEDEIRARLSAALMPMALTVHNDSHLHQGSSDASHFRIIITTAAFVGKTRVQRHRLVYQALAGLSVHALSIQARDPDQASTPEDLAATPCVKAR
ncbi:MAG: BolA family protein [Pseudomonadota bacterium]